MCTKLYTTPAHTKYSILQITVVVIDTCGKEGAPVALRPHIHQHVQMAGMAWKVLEKGAFRLPKIYSENSLNFHPGF